MTRKLVRTDGAARWRARSRVWVFGVIGLMAATLLGFVGVIAMTSGHTEIDQVRRTDHVLQQVVDLRTLLAEFQVYAEPHLAATNAAPVEGAALAEGAGIVTSESAQALRAAKGLASIGLTAMSRDLDAAQVAYTAAVTGFTPLLTGGVSTVDVAALAAAGRTAYVEIWKVTGRALTEARHTRDLHVQQGAAYLADGRTRVLVGGGLMALIALCGIAVFGQHAHRSERSKRGGALRQQYEASLQQALEMAKAEGAVYAVVGEALHESVPSLEVEMLVADSSRAHFHQSLDTGIDGPVGRVRSGCGVVSPTDCAATIRGHTLVFPTSQAFSACPYLRGRASGECSAVCVPVSIGGRSVGVTHATGADGVPATETEVQYLEISTRRASERIAMLRAFEKSETQARTDPLTGLWNRRSLENQINDMKRQGVPYALAYGDLDHFKTLNDTHGHEAGDQALRLFSRVLRDSIRPNDIAARYGGEEFVIVLPEGATDTATAVLERVRERLALALTTGRVPAFTVSFGLASSQDADTFDEVVAIADGALLAAKAAGRNRVVVAVDPPEPHLSVASERNGEVLLAEDGLVSQ